MGLDLWFREDVARILASTYETIQASTGAVAPVSPELADTYRRGFMDALYAVAVAFGVTAPSLHRGQCERFRFEPDSESLARPGSMDGSQRTWTAF
jgi:hypothetical protein